MCIDDFSIHLYSWLIMEYQSHFITIQAAQSTPQGEADTIQKVETPKKYKVLLHNDDFTPMEFVIFILENFFQKNPDEAQKIMLNVHNNGVGIAGVYTLEIAEMKVQQVTQIARKNQYPLKTTAEPE